MVVDISFGVGQNGFVALHLKFEGYVFDMVWLLDITKFGKNFLVSKG